MRRPAFTMRPLVKLMGKDTHAGVGDVEEGDVVHGDDRERGDVVVRVREPIVKDDAFESGTVMVRLANCAL